MALLAAVPHPVQLVRSTTAYLLAPTPLDDGVAYLTVPRALGGPAWMARISGDRLVVQRTSGVRTLFDAGCEVAAECNAVRAPVGDGVDVVYGVPNDGGGGYVARAGVNGRSQIVSADETTSGAVLAYTAAAGMTVYLSKGAIVSRRHRAACDAGAAGGDRWRRARRRGLGSGRRVDRARPGSRGAWYVGRQGRHRRRDGRHRPAARRAARHAGARPTTARWRSRAACPCRARSARFEIVAIARRGRRGDRRLAGRPDPRRRPAAARRDPRHDGRLPAPRRRRRPLGGNPRDRPRGRYTRTIARVGRRAARMSDPAVDATRIVWSQADSVPAGSSARASCGCAWRCRISA